MKICTASSKECVSCGSCRRKLSSVSNKLRDYFCQTNKIIIKHCQKICITCNTHQQLVKIKKLDTYSPLKHTLSQRWMTRSERNKHKTQQQVEHLQCKFQQLQQKINHLKRIVPTSTKHEKVKLQTKQEFEEELKQIPNESKSSKWTNNLNYKLFTEADCHYWTGFGRSKIIEQAQCCDWTAEWVFHLRLRIKHYIPLEFQCKMFGFSTNKLVHWMDKTLHVINIKYAKPVLLNAKPLQEQYQSRQRIKDNTPKFAMKLRGIEETEDKIIVTCDSTYQYTQIVQTNHDIRKKTTNMHKHSNLVKVHLWACANGQPIYSLCVFGDGYHADGPIFEATLNIQYVRKCRDAIRNNKITKEIAFQTIEACQELENLQELIKPRDHCVVDNGYKIQDPRKKAPADAPKDHDEDGRTTVLAASHKRSCSAIRQTHERINSYVKRNAMCRKKIFCDDIHRMPKIWNICLADMIHEKTILMKDDENSEALTQRILDMRHVATNPADYWLYKIPKQNTTKAAKKKSSKSGDEEEEQQQEEEESTDCQSVNDEDQQESGEWVTVAEGWSNIVKYIQKCELKDVLKDLVKVKRCDVMSYNGKKYENSLTKGYLRRLNYEEKTFRLKMHKIDPFVYLFENVKSKWKSSKRYCVILSFQEIVLWQKSLRLWKNKNCELTLAEDETHWLKWLQNDQKQKVSDFLSPKYKKRDEYLEKKRVQRMEKRRELWYGNVNVGKMKKQELLYFAKENQIDVQNAKTMKEILAVAKDWIKKKKTEKNKQNVISTACASCKEADAQMRCSNCKLIRYCSKQCQKNHWSKHKKICAKLKSKKNQDNTTTPTIPQSLQYLKKYPVKKSWWDLDFTLFDSKLARLQAGCICRSGAQLPGCCAHAGSILWLIFFILFGNVAQILKPSERDKRILKSIVDLTPYNRYRKSIKKDNSFWCVCRQDKGEEFVQCDCCMIWYHPSCVSTTMEDIESDRYVFDTWHCKFCDGDSVFVVRNI